MAEERFVRANIDEVKDLLLLFVNDRAAFRAKETVIQIPDDDPWSPFFQNREKRDDDSSAPSE